MKRTIYADRDGLLHQVQLEQQAALDSTAVTNIPHYRKQYWRGRAEGLAFAAALLRDWAGEEEPGHESEEDRSEWPLAGFAVQAEIRPGTNRQELADFIAGVLTESLLNWDDIRHVEVTPERDM